MLRSLLLPLIIVAVLLASCATVVAPSGGPEDKTPPRVLAVFPAPKSTQVSSELDVRVQFDEWILDPLPKGAIRISPPLMGRLKTQVQGDLLQINSSAPLDSGITYSVLISNAVKDLRNNPLAKPFHLVFSTGSQLDSLQVSGWVSIPDSVKRSKNFPVVGLYPMGESRQVRRYLSKWRDSTNIKSDSIPKLDIEPVLFLSQTDSNGRFTINGVAPGPYRIAAFLDANNNNTIDLVDELAGTGESDLQVLHGIDSLYIQLGMQDTASIKLSEVQQTGAQFIRFKFSRSPLKVKDWNGLNACGLYSLDTVLRMRPTTWWPLQDSSQLVFAFQDIPSLDSIYLAGCAKQSYYRIQWSDMKDTSKAQFQRFALEGPNPTLDSMPLFFAQYSKAIDADTLLPRVRVVTGTDTLPVVGKQRYANSWEARPKQALAKGSTVQVLLSYQDTLDTLVQQRWQTLGRFETINPLKLGSIQGLIPGANNQTYVRLQSHKDKSTTLARCNPEGRFWVPSIPEGSYKLDYFLDLDGNGIPHPGSLIPFSHAEPWRFVKDTVFVSTDESSTHLDSIIYPSIFPRTRP